MSIDGNGLIRPGGGVGPAGASANEAATDLLHCLGFIYLRNNQPRRAVVLLMVAVGASKRESPELLATLAAALLAAGMADQAEGTLDRLDALDPTNRTHAMRRLMRARILLLRGELDEARRVFAFPTSQRISVVKTET